MGLETALAVGSFGLSVAQAQQQSATGKYNQAIQKNDKIGRYLLASEVDIVILIYKLRLE